MLHPESETDILLWLFASCLINLLFVPPSFTTNYCAENVTELVCLKKKEKKQVKNVSPPYNLYIPQYNDPTEPLCYEWPQLF